MKRLPFLHLLCCLFLIAMAGCSKQGLIEKMMSPEDDATAKKYIALMRDDKFEEIAQDIDPALKASFTHDAFEKMRALIPMEEPVSVKPVGLQKNTHPTYTHCNITYEYEFPEKWMLINVATHQEGDTLTIVGIGVQPIRDAVENINRFTLSGKSPLHYLMLALTCAVPLFTLYALIVCIRTKNLKRKWLWVIFIILGLGRLSLNWTSGQWSTRPGIVRTANGNSTLSLFDVELFGASANADLYGPWVLSVSLPLGAILFLLKRRRMANAMPGEDSRNPVNV